MYDCEHEIDCRFGNVESSYRYSPWRNTLNTSYITRRKCKVCTKAVRFVALQTRVTSQVTCLKSVPKQSVPQHFVFFHEGGIVLSWCCSERTVRNTYPSYVTSHGQDDMVMHLTKWERDDQPTKQTNKQGTFLQKANQPMHSKQNLYSWKAETSFLVSV